MLGAIIGDICGSTYEFSNERNINKIKLFNKGSFPTDDSVMTVAVARALMDYHGKREEAIKEGLVSAMHYYGNLFPKAGYGGAFSLWLSRFDRKPYNSFGNGAGMRVSSVGWLYNSLEETLRMAKLTAEVTHNHPEGIKGAQAIAAAIYLARTGMSREAIRAYTEKNFYSLDFTLNGIRDNYSFNETCQGSCPMSIEAFLESKDFEDAILKAISIGGDSDTIAAMTGAIAEAYYGIPKEIEKKALESLIDGGRYGCVYNNSVLAEVALDFRKYLDKVGIKRHR